MIIDVTGVELSPGNCGVDCLGNGERTDKNGNLVECCCDECDYLMCCLPEHKPEECLLCEMEECPRKCIDAKN